MLESRRKEIENIFLQLTEQAETRAGQDTERLLAEYCGADTELMQGVRRLIELDDRRLSGFMEAPEDAADRLPERIGGYRVLDRLGEGGMGTVYLAEQSSPQRQVALKVLRSGLADPAVRRRFEYEAEILARLRHPGIASVYEAGVARVELRPGWAAELPYFAMELIEGKPLDEYARGAHPSIRERLAMLQQICEAVQSAHQQGVIHRDLKPANILVTDAGFAKVVDFGVARVLNSSSTTQENTTHSLVTQPGQLIGTLAYMSPEQIGGDSAVDTRSDVYALGVVAYELLCGRPPVDVRGLTLPEAARRITEQLPRALSAHDTRLRGDIEAIVHRALEPDKQRRYASAAEMAADLSRYLQGLPIVARRARGWYLLGKLIRRHKLASALIAGMVTLAVLSTAVTTVLWRRAERQRALAEAAQQHEAEARTEAERVADFLQGMLQHVSPAVALGRDTTMLMEMLDYAARRIEAGELQDAPTAEWKLRMRIGKTYLTIDQRQRCRAMLEPALRLAEQRFGRHDQRYAASLLEWAELQHIEGDYGQAAEKKREAMQLQRALPEPDPLEIAHCQVSLATSLRKLGELKEAKQLLELALQTRRNHLGPHDPLVARSLRYHALVLRDLGEWDRAEKAIREALAIHQESHGDDYPDVITDRSELAALLMRRGELVESERLLQQVLASRRRVYPHDHGLIVQALATLGSNYLGQSKLDQAASLWEEALQLERSRESPNPTHLFSLLLNLAIVRERQGEIDDAEQFAAEAMHVNDGLPGPRKYERAVVLDLLAAIEVARGRYEAALDLRQQSLENGRQHFEQENDFISYLHSRLASVHLELGEHKQAEEHARKALAITRRLPGPLGEPAAAQLAVLADALIGQARLDEAQPLLEESLALIEARFPDGHPLVASIRASQAQLAQARDRLKKIAIDNHE